MFKLLLLIRMGTSGGCLCIAILVVLGVFFLFKIIQKLSTEVGA